MRATYPDFEFVYGDSEFTPNNRMSDGLVSTALQASNTHLYLVNAEADREAFCENPFCRDEIWSKLPLRADGSLDRSNPAVVPYAVIQSTVGSFFDSLTDKMRYKNRIGFVADHCTQDMQRIHDLFDNDWFGVMPPSVPKHAFLDLASLEMLAGVEDGHLPNGLRLPEKYTEKAHHALYDARWDREVHEFLMVHSRAVRVASGVERLED
jgi:hypothetical protein